MKKLFLLFSLVSLQSLAQEAEPSVQSTHLLIGETLEFSSEVLGEKRILHVYLPHEYSQDSVYPVIYLLDGSLDEDMIHISGLVQFHSFSWIHNLPPSIVVGIANVDRERDMTFPTTVAEDQEKLPTNGRSADFIRFLEEEVQALVENRYSLQEGERTLIGQSLGGLVSTEILFKKPEMFDHYIIISPSLWWDAGSLLDTEPETGSSPKSVYIGVGKEGKVMEEGAASLHRKLEGKYGDPVRLYFEYFPNRDHADALHEAVSDAFEKIYTK